jgi:hypothetical protein
MLALFLEIMRAPTGCPTRVSARSCTWVPIILIMIQIVCHDTCTGQHTNIANIEYSVPMRSKQHVYILLALQQLHKRNH